MRIFPISDIHANFMDTSKYSDISMFNMEHMKKVFKPLGTGADTVLLACGDVGERLQGVVWCERMLQVFPNLEICYCPGNHEFYGSNLDLLLYDMKIMSDTNPRLHILDGLYNCRAVIKDNINRPVLVVVGGTLWTDFNNQSPEIMNLAQRRMNDYNQIKSGRDGKNINANRILNLHYETRKNIFHNIENTDKSIPLVCMSHHTPYIGIPTEGLHYCYYVDMSENFNNLSRVPQYWFSGHTHKSTVKKEVFPAGEITFISNQVGYPNELSTGFTTECFVEV